MSISSFIKSDSGGVIVDWVVLTAGVVALSMATISLTSGGAENLSNEMGQDLADTEIGASFSNWEDPANGGSS